MIGAVYLDGGVEAAFGLVERLIGARMMVSAQRLDRLDYKTLLQEVTSRLFDAAPVYVVSDSGPDHAKEFEATVMVEGRAVGTGSGRSKKTAEQAAAEQAVDALVSDASAPDAPAPDA